MTSEQCKTESGSTQTGFSVQRSMGFSCQLLGLCSLKQGNFYTLGVYNYIHLELHYCLYVLITTLHICMCKFVIPLTNECVCVCVIVYVVVYKSRDTTKNDLF